MWLTAMLWRLLSAILFLTLACLATPTISGWPEFFEGLVEEVDPPMEWWEVVECAAVVWGIWMLTQQLVKVLTSLGVYGTSGPRPAVEQTIHESLSFPGLCIFSTSALQTLLRQDGPVCFAGLPAEALDYFTQSCVQVALHHQDRDSACSLPHSALSIFGSSALQHYWRSTGNQLSAMNGAALDIFEGSLLQQYMEEERVSFLPRPHVLLGQESGSSAAVPTTAGDVSSATSPQPTPLRSQSSLKQAMSGLSTFIPGLLYSSKPILTAVQPLQQPMSDPTSHPTNPIVGQGELAGEDYGHSSSMETGAGDVSPTSSSEVKGALEKNTSSLVEAIERESAADKVAREKADKVFLEKSNKPKGLRRMSSSFKDFTIKAFERSKDVESVNSIQEQTPAPEKRKIGAKAKKMAARLVPAALGGSPSRV
ncbi:hypothetical protein WJX77_007836 [Trebouxia sp. C0004]